MEKANKSVKFDTHKELPELLAEIFKEYDAARKEHDRNGNFKQTYKTLFVRSLQDWRVSQIHRPYRRRR
jgi:uncharacterized protein Veg